LVLFCFGLLWVFVIFFQYTFLLLCTHARTGFVCFCWGLSSGTCFEHLRSGHTCIKTLGSFNSFSNFANSLDISGEPLLIYIIIYTVYIPLGHVGGPHWTTPRFRRMVSWVKKVHIRSEPKRNSRATSLIDAEFRLDELTRLLLFIYQFIWCCCCCFFKYILQCILWNHLILYIVLLYVIKTGYCVVWYCYWLVVWNMVFCIYWE
jgi:hypothetical protein